MKRKHGVHFGKENGSLLLEFALAMPALFFCFSILCQLSHVMLAKQIVCYAAACAARATLVYPSGEEAKKAAKEAAPTVLSGILKDQNPVVSIEIQDAENGGTSMRNGDVVVTLTYDFPLLIPMAGMMIGEFSAKTPPKKRGEMDPVIGWTGESELTSQTGYPTMQMTEKCIIVKPYSTKSYPKNTNSASTVLDGSGGGWSW